MNITAYFSQLGTPETGLSPTINIRDISDGSLVVSAMAMTEVGDGFYWYNFLGYNPAKDYSIRCDGGTAILRDFERYAIASTGFPADGSEFTALGDSRIANLDADISSRSSHDAAAVKTAIEAAGSKITLIKTAVETTIPDSIAALPTDADVNAACDTAISDAALATASILKEVNQSLNGAKCVIDRAASTFKVYDTDGTTLLFTITKSTVGNVDTLTRT